MHCIYSTEAREIHKTTNTCLIYVPHTMHILEWLKDFPWKWISFHDHKAGANYVFCFVLFKKKVFEKL